VDDGTELVGGNEQQEVLLVPYDSAWPQRFARERARIADALRALALRIGHVGSTSVAGLVAKPIIDIDLSVPMSTTNPPTCRYLKCE
jgi:GrpB-like predicted nucleotidyltransferase (UPF0157 family)